MAKENFWNPQPPVKREPSSIGFTRKDGYIAFGIAFVVSWLIVVGQFLGWRIPPFLAGDWEWWHYVLLIVVGFPLSILMTFLGWMWFAAFCVSFDHIPHDTWKLAEKIAPSRTAPAYRILTIIEFVTCLPLILMAIGSILTRFD